MVDKENDKFDLGVKGLNLLTASCQFVKASAWVLFRSSLIIMTNMVCEQLLHLELNPLFYSIGLV